MSYDCLIDICYKGRSGCGWRSMTSYNAIDSPAIPPDLKRIQKWTRIRKQSPLRPHPSHDSPLQRHPAQPTTPPPQRNLLHGYRTRHQPRTLRGHLQNWLQMSKPTARHLICQSFCVWTDFWYLDLWQKIRSQYPNSSIPSQQSSNRSGNSILLLSLQNSLI